MQDDLLAALGADAARRSCSSPTTSTRRRSCPTSWWCCPTRPGRVHAVVMNPLGRPRDDATRVSDEFAAAKRVLWNELQAARRATPALAG